MENLSDQVRLQIDETSTSRKYWDSKSKETGFEDIEDFLGYFRLHSRTPRALFPGQHVEVVLALLEYSQKQRESMNPFNEFNIMKYDPKDYEIMEKKVNSLI